MSEPTFLCKHCGENHPMLMTLPQACLDAYEPVTTEQIEAAFAKGRQDREAFEQTLYSMIIRPYWPVFRE